MNNFKYCKLEVFIPEDYLEKLIKVFDKNDIGHIGNYKGCLSYSKVKGRWISLNESNPYLGSEGEETREAEIKVEVRTTIEIIDDLISEIKEIHPYEEPVINVIPLYK